MNYEKIYNNLIINSKNRDINSIKNLFLNTHHIIPKHCGGTDDPSNLVVLTYKEHILAHRLLYEINKHIKDLYAYLLMSGKTAEAALEIKRAGGRKSGKIVGLMAKNSGRLLEMSKKYQKLGAICRSYQSKYMYTKDSKTWYYSIHDLGQSCPEIEYKSLRLWAKCEYKGFKKRLKTKEELKYSLELIDQVKAGKE